jgi:hypothetical protein
METPRVSEDVDQDPEDEARLRQAGNPIALTTVYRAVRAYAETGRVANIHNPGGEQLFHLTAAPQCSKVVAVLLVGRQMALSALVRWFAVTAPVRFMIGSASNKDCWKQPS